MVADTVAGIGRYTLDTVALLGRSAVFLSLALYNSIVPPYNIRRILSELEFIGARSLLIICVTALFTGMVLGLQGYYTLSKFGSETLLGSAVALSIIRELGPVLTALMVTGRAGSSITAEIGIMKITDQIPALEMMAVDPLKYVVSPKIMAGILSVPLLTAIFDVVGIFGGYMVGVRLLGVNEGAFFGEMISSTSFDDIYGGFIKSVVFGLMVTWICSFVGYISTPTTEGVSRATTNAVVVTSLAILMMDYVLTSILL